MKFPTRKTIRLKNYDYSQNGDYFITICTYNRECLFGEINYGIMLLSTYGKIVLKHIGILSDLYDTIKIDKYVIMPNHIHMIIRICAKYSVCNPLVKDKTKMLIPKIIQIFKSSITKEIRMLENWNQNNARNENNKRNAYNAFPTIWQSHYYEHIIRTEKSYQKIWQYIDNNISSWEQDKLFTI